MRDSGNLTFWCEEIPSEPWLQESCWGSHCDGINPNFAQAESGLADPAGVTAMSFSHIPLLLLLVCVWLFEEMPSFKRLSLDSFGDRKETAPGSFSHT